ncbi:MAG: hypothetical protein V9E94_03290 [Microthrixaceae bacterium]
MIKFPFKLYKGDPDWVPALIGDRKKHLDPKHNPSFEYLQVAYFVAEATVIPDHTPKGTITGGMEQDVGTIAAILNPLPQRDPRRRHRLLRPVRVYQQPAGGQRAAGRGRGLAARAGPLRHARAAQLHHDR